MNIHGPGEWSPISSNIVMYGKPTQPSSVVIVESGTNIEIQWASPSSTGGLNIALTGYEV